jgi:class 3 adenylate cyclase
MKDLERRLAAVLNADVVGFTRLMVGDDVATVRAVAALRDDLDTLVREHEGRVVDFVGDNFLAEFRSALGAVRCAIALQRALEDRNEGLPPARRLLFRIGVHLGDVIVEGPDAPGDRPTRRLAALLVCDGAGYTRLSAHDEVGAFETLASFEGSLPALVRQLRGRIVDQVGDGFFAEFPTASEAVGCAIEIQRWVELRNRELPEQRRLGFRISVHLDEVIFRGERLYGQGVHAAHQLAALAPGGEVYVSHAVHERVEEKLGLAFERIWESTPSPP